MRRTTLPVCNIARCGTACREGFAALCVSPASCPANCGVSLWCRQFSLVGFWFHSILTVSKTIPIHVMQVAGCVTFSMASCTPSSRSVLCRKCKPVEQFKPIVSLFHMYDTWGSIRITRMFTVVNASYQKASDRLKLTFKICADILSFARPTNSGPI